MLASLFATGSALAFSLRAQTPALGSQLPTVGKPTERVVAEKSQYEITANDNGKTYTFGLGVRFAVFLDEDNYPKADLTCKPNNIIASAAADDTPVAALPLWVVRYYTVGVGQCTLKDKDFSMKIVVQEN